MTKQTFLKTLRDALNMYDFTALEKEDIINDYTSLWDEYQFKGMEDDAISKKLGDPYTFVSELSDGHEKLSHKKARNVRSRNNKWIALTPFIALILFFLLGFTVPGAWMYAWLTFLIIPMSAIILEGPSKLLLKLTALSPFLALIIYFLVLGPLNLWYPGWVIFAIIPAIGLLNDPNKQKVVIFETALIVTIGLYLYVLHLHTIDQAPVILGWTLWPSELIFVPLLLVVSYEWLKNILKNGKMYLILLLVSAVLFVFIGFNLPNGFLIAWLPFFSIPLYGIYKNVGSKDKLVAMMPMISTTIFILLGYFFNAWSLAWLVYLLIPMTAIIKNT